MNKKDTVILFARQCGSMTPWKRIKTSPQGTGPVSLEAAKAAAQPLLMSRGWIVYAHDIDTRESEEIYTIS